MSLAPSLSVVMSVFNSADTLGATMDSVLTQEEIDFEFIVVDDGSSDGSAAILDDYARRDERVRVIHQDNTGLTRALMNGCARARGKYLARQDAGDVSLAGRLAQQCALLESHPDVVLTSVGTRFIGSEGEHLYTIVQLGDELQRGLEQLIVARLRGPSHHGSTMFRQAAYHAVGGYRREFRVAQDLDLWTRLVDAGRCVAIPEVLYEAKWQLGSISHLRRRDQLMAAEAIHACRQRRHRGGSEQPILDRLTASLGEIDGQLRTPSGLSEARFHYFLGSVLASNNPGVARRYLKQAVRAWPWHAKAWVKLAALVLRPGK
ncbi:glycosyltransferase family 2 protein [uncultured Thiodictyon sp.]|uniref:glycosyltransferase family 2 protein n=1 Tax=uncultured Thiodictyon sp. TaxID=1846217 RepID=UPI0025D5637F|nr:glycosyltransferase family 2 protein [uncultured Thiodictyon sp.]